MAAENIERFDFYFDTSAINNLYNNLLKTKEDPLEWAKKFENKYSVLISTINIAEICATKDPELRQNLLRFCYELLQGEKEKDKYLPADFPFELLKKALNSYFNKKNRKSQESSYKGEFCASINLNENAGLWIALLGPKRIDDKAREECWNYCEEQKNWYEDMHRKGRKAFQDVIETETEQNFMAYANSLSAKTALIGEVVEKISKESFKGITEELFTENLLQEVCVWRSFYYTLMYEIYHRGIKRENYGKDKNPGSLDIQQAVYLCFAKTFVTHDQALLNHFKAIIGYSGINTEVWNSEFFIGRISIA